MHRITAAASSPVSLAAASLISRRVRAGPPSSCRPQIEATVVLLLLPWRPERGVDPGGDGGGEGTPDGPGPAALDGIDEWSTSCTMIGAARLGRLGGPRAAAGRGGFGQVPGMR